MTDIIHGRYEVVRSLAWRDGRRRGGHRSRWPARRVEDAAADGAAATRAVDRFRREASTMASLRHPHIVEYLGFLDAPPVMVLELLQGASLKATLRNEGTLPLAMAARVGMQIASALAAAHAVGIVHRDVKPGNIFLGQHAAKLLDFGVAKVESAEGPPLTQASAVVGSALYLSPEQIRSEPVHEHSDTYALGLCVYEMVTGQQPFSGNVHQVMVKILGGESIPAHPALPAGLHAVLQRATSLEPARRFQSADEMSRALAPFAHAATPRTQLSAAIVPDSGRMPPSSARTPGSGMRHPTAPMQIVPSSHGAPSSPRMHVAPSSPRARVAPPAYEMPSPASMTAPLVALREVADDMTQKMPRELQPRAASPFATTFRSVGAPAPQPMPIAAPPRPSGGVIVAGLSLLVVAGLGAGGVWLWTTTRAAAAPMAAAPLAASLPDAAALQDAAALDPGSFAAASPTAAASAPSVAPDPSVEPLVHSDRPVPAKAARKAAPAAIKQAEMPADR